LNRWENPEAIEELKKAIEGNDNLSYAHFELGLAYLRSGDLEHAEPEFRRDIALEPELADNYEQLGILYVRKGERERGEEFLREALKRDGNRASAHLELAKSASDGGRYREALREVSMAVKLAPEVQRAHFVRGRVLLKLGRESEGRAELAKAQQIMDAGLKRDREKLEGRAPDPALRDQP